MLSEYQEANGVDDLGLATTLQCSPEALTRLALCRCPDDRRASVAQEVQAIATFAPCSADALIQLLRQVAAISWRALQGRLGRIKRLKIFDSTDAPALKYETMLQPGGVSILDLSDTDSPQIRNLVIAELLRGVQAQQEINYKSAVANGKQPTPTVVLPFGRSCAAALTPSARGVMRELGDGDG